MQGTAALDVLAACGRIEEHGDEPKPEEPAAPPAEDVQAPVAPQPVPTNAENRVTSTTVPAPPRSKKTTGGVPPSIFDAY